MLAIVVKNLYTIICQQQRGTIMITKNTAIKDFSWLGSVKEVYQVGPYSIVEYVRNDDKTTNFGTYIDGKQSTISYHSLDAALAGCIAYRAEGPNCQASHYFIKSLGL